jgi:hypothetical protein
MLFAEAGDWRYGDGTLSGSAAAGTVHFPTGSRYGTFNIVFGPDGSLSGTILEFGQTLLLLRGQRFFPSAEPGPLDGSYAVTELRPDGSRVLNYIVGVHSGSEFGFAILFPTPRDWTYGVGTLNGDAASGTLHRFDGRQYGTFQATITPDGHVGGLLYVEGNPLPISIQGQKFF